MSNTPNGGDSVVLAQGRNKVPKHYNRYPLGYKFASSERFGEISPFYRYRGVDGDKGIVLHSSASVDSMSLNAPILQNIRKNLDFYQVDLHAILPRNWDFIKSLPERGDDIDARKANCLICFRDDNSSPVLASGLGSLAELVDIFDNPDFTHFQYFMRFLAVWDSLFSHDSLFAAYRMPLADFLDPDGGELYISLLDTLWSFYHAVFNLYVNVVGSSSSSSIQFLDSDGNVVFSKVYDFAQLSDRMQFYYDFLDNPSFTSPSSSAGGILVDDFNQSVANVVVRDDYSNFQELFDADGSTLIADYFPENHPTKCHNANKPINIEMIIGYQLTCAEFFTNDHVDYIFDAKLYRELFESYYVSNVQSTFAYNGNLLTYDGFSAENLDVICQSLPGTLEFNLFLSLITRKRSLRYKDYFTGSRTSPLAVGDNNIQVNDNVASVIDITQKIQLVRLRMAVHRVGRKARDYVSRVLGGTPRVDRTIPVKIGHIDTSLYTEETQNTATEQLDLDNSRSAVLKNHVSRFGFETDSDEDSLILGLSSYDIVRFYDRGFDPFGLKVDRFDMFIPEMQYIGDQPISRSELNAGADIDLPFGYTARHMEYKTSVDYCCGAFRDSLAPWIFTQPVGGIKNGGALFLNPDFIRSHQCELDKYYIALTATTPNERFHFICKYNNDVHAYRNMVVAPQILQ